MLKTFSAALKNDAHIALLIIDMQYDFLPGGSLAVPQGDQIIPVINRLQPHFALNIATQDWHPEHHSSFASQYDDYQPFDVIEHRGFKQTLWPDHCLQGSKGAELTSQLDQQGIEAIIRKGMDPEIDSYSGFYDNNHEKSTGLASYLREKGVDCVYCCGLAADICVYYSAKDALQLGFETYIIEDATRPIDEQQYETIKQTLEKLGVKFTTSHNVLA